MHQRMILKVLLAYLRVALLCVARRALVALQKHGQVGRMLPLPLGRQFVDVQQPISQLGLLVALNNERFAYNYETRKLSPIHKA